MATLIDRDHFSGFATASSEGAVSCFTFENGDEIVAMVDYSGEITRAHLKTADGQRDSWDSTRCPGCWRKYRDGCMCQVPLVLTIVQ